MRRVQSSCRVGTPSHAPLCPLKLRRRRAIVTVLGPRRVLQDESIVKIGACRSGLLQPEPAGAATSHHAHLCERIVAQVNGLCAVLGCVAAPRLAPQPLLRQAEDPDLHGHRDWAMSHDRILPAWQQPSLCPTLRMSLHRRQRSMMTDNAGFPLAQPFASPSIPLSARCAGSPLFMHSRVQLLPTDEGRAQFGRYPTITSVLALALTHVTCSILGVSDSTKTLA